VIDEEHRVTVMQSFPPKEWGKDTESGDGAEAPGEGPSEGPGDGSDPESSP
jgi:hypothetical protein